MRPESCAVCGALLLGEDVYPARRQVIDITATGTYLTEYRRHALQGLACRKLNRADWSETARNGAFGEKVSAVVGYLTGRLGISHRDVVQTLQELFAVKISLGSISALQRRLSQALAAPVAEIHTFVQAQLTCFVDETAWREKAVRPWL